MKFSDESGWVRAAVCFAALLTHHGLRDALITALPTIAASDSPDTSITTELSTAASTQPPPTSSSLLPATRRHFAGLYDLERTVYAARRVNQTLNTSHIRNTALGSGKHEGEHPTRNTNGETHTQPVFYSVPGTEVKASNVKTPIASSNAYKPARLHEATREESDQSGVSRFPLGASSLRLKTGEKSEASDVSVNSIKESEISRLPAHVLPLGTYASSPEEGLGAETPIRRQRSIEGHLAGAYDHNAIHSLIRGGARHVLGKNGKVPTKTGDSALDQHVGGGDSGQQVEEEQVEVVLDDMEDWTALESFLEEHPFKEEWSLMVEGLVLSSVFWGWFFTALLADTLMDKVGVVRVLAFSEGVAGLLGLVTHAVSSAGPWALVGLRVAQGAVQGMSYPAVVRVLEGVPSSGRASMALFVYLGPSLGTGLGAGMGCLPKWYIATYVLGSLAVALTLLCLLLPQPPEETPHKEMQLKQVLGCRGVWACVGVHLANTWMLHTLLLGLPLCLTYTALDLREAGGWVVALAAVAVGVVVQANLFVASKLSMKRALSVLSRRRLPVMIGTLMVVVAIIILSTAGLDSAEVLVGVGVGLAGVGVGVARMGYRLNVDDIAPLEAWRVTRVLDAVAVVVAALCPLAVYALAEAERSGWVAVWLVPLFALVPSAVAYIFLLTTNQQPWDQKGEPKNGVVANGAAGGAPVSPVNGSASFSVGRQSFKSARSNLTFKTARSRSRTRTVSCRTIDDDLEGDMHSAVGTNSVDCRSVVEEADPECVSVASSSTFKSDGADMHSVVDEADGGTTQGKQPGQQFGSMLVNGGTTDRTSAWLSSHHDLVLEADQTPTRAGTHSANAIYGLVW